MALGGEFTAGIVAGLSIGLALGVVATRMLQLTQQAAVQANDDPFADETPEQKSFWDQLHRDAQIQKWELGAIGKQDAQPAD